MAKEIEYKYLVDASAWAALEKPSPEVIVQSYLHKAEDKTVRVRVRGNKAYLTIKGGTIGVTRSEFEYEIPVNEAEEMIHIFQLKHIRKQRYEIPVGKHVWEVDVFEGPLEGLILAEIELSHEEEEYVKPSWITEDVSRDPNYYNAVLIDRC